MTGRAGIPRRTLGGLAAAALVALPGLPPGAPLPAAQTQPVPGIEAPAAADAELVTVTPTSADATWSTPSASDTTVCVGTSPAGLRCDTQERGLSAHYAHLSGLEPGTRYYYALESDGAAQPVTSTNPGTFVTLTPPPGRHLFDFAEMNDAHLGEQCAGTAVTAPLANQSFPPCFSAPDYAARMDAAEVAEIRRRGDVRLTIVDGDLTSDASLAQVERAKQIFDDLPGEWFAARGNHDRAGQHPGETGCGPGDDCFRRVLFPHRRPGRIYYSFSRNGHHFVVLDSNDATGAGDLTDTAQNAFLRADLDRHPREPTFIFFHHPVSEYADAYEAEPVVFGVRPDRGGTAFLRLMASHPNVVGVFNAHTHRNFVSYSPWTGVRLPYIESGAAKEYPGGYSIVSVYSGGYMRTFHRPRDCSFCRSWTATTRSEYLWLYPYYTLGTLDSRNFAHVYRSRLPTPPPSPPGNASAP